MSTRFGSRGLSRYCGRGSRHARRDAKSAKPRPYIRKAKRRPGEAISSGSGCAPGRDALVSLRLPAGCSPRLQTRGISGQSPGKTLPRKRRATESNLTASLGPPGKRFCNRFQLLATRLLRRVLCVPVLSAGTRSFTTGSAHGKTVKNRRRRATVRRETLSDAVTARFSRPGALDRDAEHPDPSGLGAGRPHRLRHRQARRPAEPGSRSNSVRSERPA
jgi:hypothetical protein